MKTAYMHLIARRTCKRKIALPYWLKLFIWKKRIGEVPGCLVVQSRLAASASRALESASTSIQVFAPIDWFLWIKEISYPF